MEEAEDRRADGPDWKAAEAYGIDMSLLESNLRRTPEQRIRAHERVRAMVRALREGMRKRHG